MPAGNEFVAINPHCALKNLEEPCLYDIKNDERGFVFFSQAVNPNIGIGLRERLGYLEKDAQGGNRRGQEVRRVG